MPAAKTTNTVEAKYRPACTEVKPMPFMRMAGAAAKEANRPLSNRLIDRAGRMKRLSAISLA